MLHREIMTVCCEIGNNHIIKLRGENVQFLGPFAKLRKAIMSFARLSVRPSVRMAHLGSY